MLALTVAGIKDGEPDVHAILTMSADAVEFELPALPVGSGTWRWTPRKRRRTTSRNRRRVPLAARSHRVTQRGVVVLKAHPSYKSVATDPAEWVAIARFARGRSSVSVVAYQGELELEGACWDGQSGRIPAVLGAIGASTPTTPTCLSGLQPVGISIGHRLRLFIGR